jgi:hypothetical protein
MKAFRFEAEAPVHGSGMKQDTGFRRPRKARAQNPVRNFSDRPPAVNG